MKQYFLLIIFLLFFSGIILAGHRVTFQIATADNIKPSVQPEGRLFLFISEKERPEPRTVTWPHSGNHIFAKNLKAFDGNISISASSDLVTTADFSLDDLADGTYYVQCLWDQDRKESRIDAPGNMYSKVQKVDLDGDQTLELSLSETIGPRTLTANKFVKEITLTSDTLSAWWGKKMDVKASVLLPSGYYDHPNKKYPVRYNVAGYGGRYTRVNYLMGNPSFATWWQSDDAPQIINVFLDGEGPFGDSYQMDSENSGPYGYSLIHELIPYIEKEYHGKAMPAYRFVDGCSTGGWVSLALQVYYPDEFNGCWSYSPDAVEFENYQLINIYKDDNAYVNEFGLERPVMRSTKGEPMMLLRDFIKYENVLGRTNSYVTSGGQFSAHTALYGPKGDDGLPKPLFDPQTGKIDKSVAEYWKKYDIKLHLAQQWQELGPKLQGKIHIWMGDMDNFYLNMATRTLDDFLLQTENPTSDAEILFTPQAGHCANYSHKKIIELIDQKVADISKK